MDLRRRPKRNASEATPRILPRLRRWPPAVGVKEESAVAGRESAAPREDLCVNGTMSSSVRELAEKTSRANQHRCAGALWRVHEKHGGRNVQYDGDSIESKTPCPLPFEFDFALGTIEKLRRRGAPAFRESTGFADFWKKSVLVEKRRARERERVGGGSKRARNESGAGERCCMGEGEGPVSMAVGGLMK